MGVCRSREMKKRKNKAFFLPLENPHPGKENRPKEIIIQDKHCNKSRCQRVEGI